MKQKLYEEIHFQQQPGDEVNSQAMLLFPTKSLWRVNAVYKFVVEWARRVFNFACTKRSIW